MPAKETRLGPVGNRRQQWLLGLGKPDCWKSKLEVVWRMARGRLFADGRQGNADVKCWQCTPAQSRGPLVVLVILPQTQLMKEKCFDWKVVCACSKKKIKQYKMLCSEKQFSLLSQSQSFSSMEICILYVLQKFSMCTQMWEHVLCTRSLCVFVYIYHRSTSFYEITTYTLMPCFF